MTDRIAPAPYWFFLGGRDLEMQTIRELLEVEAPGRFSDKGLAWGARASDYGAEIQARLAAGFRPVLVELEWDLGEVPDAVVIVDHHGARAGMAMPGSLRQVFTLLDLPQQRWSRYHDLVAANDSGYIPGMKKLGASDEEINTIRSLDRRSQGLTAEQERQAEQAVANCRELVDGRLIEVDLPHARTAPVADRLFARLHDPVRPATLAVFSPAEVNVFAPGAVVAQLDAAFPGGWKGGALPDYGYWGLTGETELLARVRSFLRTWLDQRDGQGGAAVSC